MGTSGDLARLKAAAGGPLVMGVGVGGVPLWPSNDAELEAWLLLRVCQARYWSKQWLQVREGTARGLKLASWSRGTSKLEWKSQKMLPQRRQWWRRTK